MNILLIGKRAKILEQVKEQLLSHGCDVLLTNNLDLDYLKSLDASSISCVAYGQALTKEQKQELTEYYRQQNPLINTIEGWAPIPELITRQILASIKPISELAVSGTNITAAKDIKLSLKAYKLNLLYQLKTKEIDIDIQANVLTDINDMLRGFTFFSLECNESYSVLRNH